MCYGDLLDERFSVTVTANVKLYNVSKAFPFLLLYRSLVLQKSGCFTLFSSIRIVLDCFRLIICYFEKFST